jgi:hypothetical protein
MRAHPPTHSHSPTHPPNHAAQRFSDASEFVPVMVGFWNCLDSLPPSGLDIFAAPEVVLNSDTNSSSTQEEDESQTVIKDDFNDLFRDTSELERVGGQSYGAQSRCFSSSLVPATDVTNVLLSFSTNGLCYVANCYSRSYMQVGIVQPVSGLLYWCVRVVRQAQDVALLPVCVVGGGPSSNLLMQVDRDP